jgi:hypothetical protein
MSEERSRILKMVAEGKITPAEAEELLDALKLRGAGGPQPETGATQPKPMPKFMYVKVIGKENDNVDVKIPLSLVRAGMRFTSLIPPIAVAHINESMGKHGMNFDLNSIKAEDIDALITGLTEMEVNVQSKTGDNVRVYCA